MQTHSKCDIMGTSMNQRLKNPLTFGEDGGADTWYMDKKSDASNYNMCSDNN